SRAIADPVQQGHQPALRWFIISRSRGGPATPFGRLRYRAGRLARRRERPRRIDGATMQRRPLPREPLVEFTRRIRNEEAIQQIASIEGEGGRNVTVRQRLPERLDIAPHALGSEADGIAVSLHDVRAESAAQKMNSLAERAACAFLIQFRPEQGEQRVAPVATGRRRKREVREKREALGLREHRAQLPFPRVAEVCTSERTEADGGAVHGGRFPWTGRRAHARA